jgi:cobalt-zinc-cadmium efflux system outer membrane protein
MRPRAWLSIGFVAVGLAGCRTDREFGPQALPLPPLDTETAQVTAGELPPPRPVQRVTSEPRRLGERLAVPPELPGANSPPAVVPRREESSEVDRNRVIAELFGDLPVMPADPVPTAGPKFDLADLERRAMELHPTIRQAANAVESARGAAVQAGLPPNPTFGFEADTVGSGGTAGQQGGKYEQLIKTAGKLKLAEQAALMDVVNAQVALRRAQIDLATQVRGAYFGVLVAQENLRLNHGLAQFAEAIYQVQVDHVRSGQAATYEPLALRALAEQARLAFTQSQNRYQAAWRQLSVAVGDPDMQPAALAGAASMRDPGFDYEPLRTRMLAQHTDLVTAANSVVKARYNLRLQEVTPFPDVALKLVVQKDYSTPPFNTTTNIEVGVPVPVWDRNQGAIRQARADLARAIDDIPRSRLDLLNRLADAMERYQTNRAQVDAYLNRILPDQVRSYRGLVQQPKPEFGDILSAQQQLNSFVAAYLSALQAQWQAIVDLAALAQMDDLYLAIGGAECGPVALPAADLPVLSDLSPLKLSTPAHGHVPEAADGIDRRNVGR